MALPNYAMPTRLILLIVMLNSLVKRLKASGDKCGMVHFELAENASNAERIMAIWRNADLEQNAHISLWLDFAFLLAYPLGLALACWALANDGSGWFAQTGVCIGFSVLASAPLDAVENAALLSMLDNGTNDSAARIAVICAAIRGPYSRISAGWGSSTRFSMPKPNISEGSSLDGGFFLHSGLTLSMPTDLIGRLSSLFRRLYVRQEKMFRGHGVRRKNGLPDQSCAGPGQNL